MHSLQLAKQVLYHGLLTVQNPGDALGLLGCPKGVKSSGLCVSALDGMRCSLLVFASVGEDTTFSHEKLYRIIRTNRRPLSLSCARTQVQMFGSA
jgi:hypothetical protein